MEGPLGHSARISGTDWVRRGKGLAMGSNLPLS